MATSPRSVATTAAAVVVAAAAAVEPLEAVPVAVEAAG